MSSKFTYRDLFVYAFNGLLGLVLISIVYRKEIKQIFFEKDIYNEGLLLFFIIPICYIIGHIILSIDNLIFMRILSRKTRKRLLSSKRFKWLHLILFGNRIVGNKDVLWTDADGDFNKTCMKIRNEGKLDRADRYYVLSDSFKGLLIVDLFVIILSICKEDWSCLIMGLFLIVVFYLRSKKYSYLYISEIKMQKQVLGI